ncbi:Hypothetical predicted protein [Cloeon dipterum]|uniref:phosphatidylserine decarboxylase n=1 Tax=Cloeon dipterum TaxID=197152 RepID=A0A8S1CZF2_9INSE|nr:Hypothetical predicted protein [Cloeon dipterum]
MCLQWLLLCLLATAVSAPSHAPASLVILCSSGYRCSLQPVLLSPLRVTPPAPSRVNITRPVSGNGLPTKGEGGWRSTAYRYLTLPVGVGISLLAVFQWRSFKRRLEDEVVEHAKDWQITCYRLIPLRAISRTVGWFMERELPEFIRPSLYSLYAKYYKCNLNEVREPDLKTYARFSDFFCRRLKDGVRPIHPSDPLVSPADGKIMQAGPVTCSKEECKEKIKEVKGVDYSLESFIGDPSWISEKQWGRSTLSRRLLHHESGTRLYNSVIYLNPGDYHRFHSPTDFRVNFRRHFQGELFSVNPLVARWIPELFSLNERAMYVGSWKHGFFSMTAVGATNVGSIRVFCDDQLRTNQPRWPRQQQRHKDTYLGPTQEGVNVKKGELFGEFRSVLHILAYCLFNLLLLVNYSYILPLAACKNYFSVVKNNEQTIGSHC